MKEIQGEKLIINGEICANEEVNLNLDNSCYEVIRIMEGNPLFLKEHLIRMTQSIILADFKYKIDENQLESWIYKLIETNKIINQNIKIVAENKDKLQIKIYLVQSYYPSKEVYENGVDTDIIKARRLNPKVKQWNSNYKKLVNEAILEKNLFEVLLVDENNEITEGSRSNVFFVKNNQIYTASTEKVLDGITRQKVVESIENEGFKLIEKSLNIDELLEIDGAFLTGTSLHILPIRRIGNQLMKEQTRQMIVKIQIAFEKVMLQ